ncbi:uncharacterized protein BCR38DRAFT_36888 [Pseudomassariella vexata]|uniref:Uncharacterized protein n=1 Tax=Pseudomassariella vexata TaxID=1141098 RepID=A0A1Y2DQW3_9PEZI|nr:uncharacterized protein BCR38DRAFT_36888 [Pseudomassariella vexata]ORY61569.1 hypothetical protein BCR38DRAFT_36888 [Pseudomassariella vexata]
MKFNLGSLSLLAAAVLASPIIQQRADMQVYKLSVSCKLNAALDGQEIKLSGSTLGVYQDANATPVQVYPTNTTTQDVLSLHMYPIGIVDHALGLTNGPGLFDFVDIVNPAASSSSGDWQTFQMSEGKITNDNVGQWLAFPDTSSSWVIRWSDNTGVTTADYMPVDVLYQSIN